eukprot:SAG31_NODE_294_length_18242_cov_28.418949_5_plen_114_part_00
MSDPTTELAQSYRRFVRVIMLPEIEKISTVLAAHNSIVDMPDKEWLKQKFPDEAVSLPYCPLHVWKATKCDGAIRSGTSFPNISSCFFLQHAFTNFVPSSNHGTMGISVHTCR